MKKEYDFHDHTLDEAIHKLHRIISDVRTSNEKCLYHFITGHGVIKKEFLKILAELNIEHNIKLGNTGTIVAVIE